jgi:thiol-disulfide isomerase/thioredoxin
MRYTFFIIALIVGVTCAFQSTEAPVQSTVTKAPEISLISPSGKTVKLSKLKGKMVLIDFWASWCGPCRKENPHVVEAFNKYKSAKFQNAKGFEVYSVSLDRNEDAWKKAIADDKLVWKNHGWDKEGAVSKVYQVYSIPSGFLVDGEGNIVAKGNELRGMGLHLALDKYIKQ